jgi:hypothetical protein
MWQSAPEYREQYLDFEITALPDEHTQEHDQGASLPDLDSQEPPLA